MFNIPQIVQSIINFKIPEHSYRNILPDLVFTLLDEKRFFHVCERNYSKLIKTYSSNTLCNTYQPIKKL